jgi:hypothetical protein
MIFWKAERKLPVLARMLRVQSLCFDATKDLSYSGKKLDNIRSIKAMIFRICGPCFLQKIAILYEDKVVIHDIIESNAADFYTKDNISDEIPLYRNLTMYDLEENDDLPNRLVVQTNDINLIRELIARGKKVSWFSDNLSEEGNFPGLFDFEHLFLNPFCGGARILLPDGVNRKIRARRYKKNFTYPFDKNKHVFFSIKLYRFFLPENLWKKIGYYPKKINYHADRYYLIKGRAKLKGQGKISYYVNDRTDTTFLNIHCQTIIIIVLSITYMVWKRSNFAMNAKKKIAKKE